MSTAEDGRVIESVMTTGTQLRAHGSVPRARNDRYAAQPLEVRGYITAVISVGAAFLAVNLASLSLEHVRQVGLFVGLLAFALLTATVKVSLPLNRSGATMSLSYAISMTAMLMLDVRLGFVITIASAWAQCTFNMKVPNPLFRALFSMASVGVAFQGAAWTFGWARTGHVDYLFGLIRPLGPAAGVYFLLNSLLVAGAVGLTTRERIGRVWADNFMWSAPGYFAGAAAAAIAYVLSHEVSYAWGALAAIPLYLTYQSYRLFISRIEDEQAQVRNLSDVQLATIEALTLAIEVKDRTSQAQVKRLQVYVEGLARAIELSEEEIRGITTAALLHDIGNLAVPEHILTRPGPLSDEEFERVKIHPRVGAEILASVPFPYPVCSLILAHHEHWDGSGYPTGLAGEAIPLGARVLGVANMFGDLLADRPYRPAYSHAAAIAILRQQAGRQLDPSLVETFLSLLPTLDSAVHTEALGSALPVEVRPHGVGAIPTALQHIAGAHREVQALYDIAQAFGSTQRVDETFLLVANRLRSLVPFTVCALFLNDDETGLLRCVFANGAGADAVIGETAASPEELTKGQWCRGLLASARPLPEHSILVSPLIGDGQLMGAMALAGGLAADSSDHRRVLERVCRQAAPALSNALAFERAEVVSRTDALTGLSNRRAAHEYITSALAAADRQHGKLAVVLLDLDGLKFLNDTFGHHLGDAALRLVGQTLQRQVRPNDLCCRYAGDEFLLVLPGHDAGLALDRCRQVQAAIDALEVEPAAGTRVRLAISAGCALYPEDGHTEHDLVAVADERMYRDKVGRRASCATPRSAKPMDLAG